LLLSLLFAPFSPKSSTSLSGASEQEYLAMSCISQPSFVRVSSSAKSTEVAAQSSNTCMKLIIEHLHEIERQRDARRDGFGGFAELALVGRALAPSTNCI
jgi:hypothetical protein